MYDFFVKSKSLKITTVVCLLVHWMRCAHIASESLKKVLFCHPETKKFHIEPANMNEAKCGDDAEIWRKSMEVEIA